MSVLKYFKNIPVAPIGRQALSVIFFQIYNEVPRKKRACRPPTGDRGGLSPPLGRPGYAPLYKLQPSPSLLI